MPAAGVTARGYAAYHPKIDYRVREGVAPAWGMGYNPASYESEFQIRALDRRGTGDDDFCVGVFAVSGAAAFGSVYSAVVRGDA